MIREVSAVILWVHILSCVSALGFQTPGFIVGKSNDETALKVYQRVASPVSCEELTFSNWDEVSVPFQLVQEKTVNDRHYWYNGQYYISFVSVPGDSSAPHGTWLVGKQPGQDSGVAYLKPQSTTYVPAGLESSAAQWKVLLNRSWETAEELVLSCSRGRAGSHFYTVQHPGSDHSTVLLETRLVDTTAGAHPPRKAKGAAFSFSFGASDGPIQYSYWHNHLKKWVSFQSTDVVSFSRGMPLWLHTVARGKIADPAILVTDEGINQGWALYFRHSDNGGEVERRIELGPRGLLHGARIEALSAEEAQAIGSRYGAALEETVRGDYIWAWLKDSNGAVNPYILKCEASSAEFVNSRGEANSIVAVFSYHDSHRRRIMERSVLARHTERLVLTRSRSLTSAVSVDGVIASEPTVTEVLLSMNGSPVHLVGLVRIAPDPISWIQDHLESHDAILSHDVPSCFFYHGGMTLPEPFVYAAEIVCVLIGAKPLTMIQYTTPTDLQWKFPLVSELINAILSVELIGSSDEERGAKIAYEIFKYRKDESLVIYNSADKNRMDLLKPFHTAQALHIVPYPPGEEEFGIESVNAAHEEQVHNSYFNGIILGYPQRFVETYCKDLPNKLSEGQLRKGLSAGKEAVSAAIATGAVSKDQLQIRINRTEGISQRKLEFIKYRVTTLY